MDTLKNKTYLQTDYLSRYSTVPAYYDTLHNRDVLGVSLPLKKDIPFVTHKVLPSDTLDSLALHYYNNPTFWWVIAAYNDISDALIDISKNFVTIKIPSIANIKFGGNR